MLTADLVNARRRGEELKLVALDDATRARAITVAGALIATAAMHVGRTREELTSAMGAIDVAPRDVKLKAGLTKLIEDRCELDADETVDAVTLRRDVFTRAAVVRAELPLGQRFERESVLAAVAAERSTTVEAIERALFADLRAAHVLRSFEAISPVALVAAYERGQAQAVLLRAVKVTVDVRCSSAGALRALFRKLKFLRLLYVIAATDRGHRIVIDGPFSLFESVAKYGLSLAMMLPALEECDSFELEAEVRWGKERTPLRFRLAGGARPLESAPPDLPDEVAALKSAFSALGTPWIAKESEEILELPGIGLCIPDLVFERAKGKGPPERVFLEVMGYWSRPAVWQRVELVQAGLATRVVFAVSSRLRVSEEVLPDDLPGALYVYKGTMNARALLERIEKLVG